MVAGEHLRRAALRACGIDGHDDRDESFWKRRPRNVVLMHRIALRAGRLEDELVFEETGLFAVESRDGIENARIARDILTERTEIDDRIEAIEAAFAGVRVVLPAAADIVAVHEIRAPQ